MFLICGYTDGSRRQVFNAVLVHSADTHRGRGSVSRDDRVPVFARVAGRCGAAPPGGRDLDRGAEAGKELGDAIVAVAGGRRERGAASCRLRLARFVFFPGARSRRATPASGRLARPGLPPCGRPCDNRGERSDRMPGIRRAVRYPSASTGVLGNRGLTGPVAALALRAGAAAL